MAREATLGELNIIEVTDAMTHVALTGKLDLEGVYRMEAQFTAHTAKRGKPAIVDLSQLHFIASVGMGMLVQCARSLSTRGARMVIVGPQPMVRNAILAAGIDRIIPIADNEKQAAQMLGVD